MSYLAIVKAAKARMMTEREHAATPPASPSKEIDRLLDQFEREGDVLQRDSVLAEAYRHFWAMPETSPLETFQAAYAKIAVLEAQANPLTAWRTLRESATVFHAENGVCPFCRQPGELHLPAEQPELELRQRRS